MKQLEIEFFWPLTEQIPLDLDFTPSIEYNREMSRRNPVWHASWQATGISPIFISGELSTANLVIKSGDSVGMLNIGSIQVSLQSKPKLYQKILYKLLGFKWEEK